MLSSRRLLRSRNSGGNREGRLYEDGRGRPYSIAFINTRAEGQQGFALDHGVLRASTYKYFPRHPAHSQRDISIMRRVAIQPSQIVAHALNLVGASGASNAC